MPSPMLLCSQRTSPDTKFSGNLIKTSQTSECEKQISAGEASGVMAGRTAVLTRAECRTEFVKVLKVVNQ